MPLVPSISFTVRFNLTGTPTLVLTDTTTYPVGAIGIYTITQPDGYVRTGNFASPDVTSSGGTFSELLRLSSTGGIQNGQYTVKYEIRTTDLVISTFTRTWQMGYDVVTLNMREEFDVFTPQLRYFDDTVYSVANWNNGAVTRAWTGVSTPTGTKTSSAVSLDMIHTGNYYDANYTITLSSSLLYTHQVYSSWLTVQETVTKTVTTYAETPPTVTALIGLIVQLKNSLESKIDTVNEFNQTRQDFEYAQSLFEHIVRRIQVNDLSGIYRDLKDLIAVLRNYQIPTYVPLNIPILPYNLGSILYGAVWGNITGSITSQTDLVNYINSQLGGQSYKTNIGDGSNTSFVVTHNLNSDDLFVEIWDNTTKEQVFTDVSYTTANSITVSFASAPTAGQYKVVVQK
jgi:hypothetical protein